MLAAALVFSAAPAEAQHHGGVAAGRAATRGSGVRAAPRGVSPRVVGVRPYRPFYGFRRGVTLGFYAGYPWYYGYPYGYYGYGYYPWDYGYYPPPGYVTMLPGHAYGGVRIQGAPRDAQVFADGYYVGDVDDFDGALQHLNLEAGPHRIEVRPAGGQPITFDVNVRPGDIVTYHAQIRVR